MPLMHVTPRHLPMRTPASPRVAVLAVTTLFAAAALMAGTGPGAVEPVSTGVAAQGRPQDPDSLQRARETLEAAARAYTRAPAIHDTLTYTVTSSGTVQPPKEIEIRLGPGHDVAVKDALLEAVAVDGRLYVTKSDAPGKYVVRPYSGDFAEALDAVVGDQGSLFEPVQIAMRSGKSVDGWLNALQFKLLGPLRICGYQSGTGPDGRTYDVVSLVSDNGELEATFDAETHFLSHISLRARPAGAPPEMVVEVQGSLSPRVLASGTGLVTFDPDGLVAVADLQSLDSAQLPTGEPAPQFELERLGGGTVSLAGLKGSVVVLDFWATWCMSCWKTLQETQRFADWASESGLPIVVLAVDTLEQLPTPAAKRDRAVQFFRSQRLTMPCLLDFDDEVFAAFGNPGLPSTVLIAPDGTIFKYHQGVLPDAVETLKAEARETARIRID